MLLSPRNKRIVCHLCGLLPLLFTAGQIPAQGAPNFTSPALELKQLQQTFEREKADEDAQYPRQRPKASDNASKPSGGVSGQKFEIFIKRISHTPSSIFSEADFEKIVSPWVNKRISSEGLAALLEALNAEYRARGYEVCRAVVRPQRVSGGTLTLTLIEGVTDAVEIKGNESTRESFIKGALPFKKGEVANHREMVNALVRFNMTHDVGLSVGISPGEGPMSTKYTVAVQEPPRWTGAFFADTLGSKSSGRYRVGAIASDRSVFGFRDSFSLMGLFSRGTQSFLASYSFPLNTSGTRLSAEVSAGRLRIVEGESKDFDFSGNSLMSRLRLEHPVAVTAQSKWTLWGQLIRQKSESDVFGDVRISDGTTATTALGVDFLSYQETPTALYGSAQLSRNRAREKVFDTKQTSYLLSGSLTARHLLESKASLTSTLHWQAFLGGGAPDSSNYFYLGASTGVRGYDNNVLSGMSGYTLSLEAKYPFFAEKASVGIFFDAGRLTAGALSESRFLMGAGTEISWQPTKWSLINFTLSLPFRRDLGGGVRSNAVRVDAVATLVW